MDWDANWQNYIVFLGLNCFICDQKFNIELKYLPDKEKIVCPNCGQLFPQEVFEKLKQVSILLKESISILDELNDMNEGWNFYLHWKECNRLPERPGWPKSRSKLDD